MSDKEYKKLRTHLRLLTLAIIILIALLIASRIHTAINPNTTSFPNTQAIEKEKVNTPSIDYGAIQKYIDQKVASIPTPQNGVDGKTLPAIIPKNGMNGTSIPGKSAYQVALDHGFQGTSDQWLASLQGKDADPSPILQIQIDLVTCQLQQKYNTSDAWVSFAQLPKPCEVR